MELKNRIKLQKHRAIGETCPICPICPGVKLLGEFEAVCLQLQVIAPISTTSKIRIIGDQSQVDELHFAKLVESLKIHREQVIAELVKRGDVTEPSEPASANHLPGRASAGGMGQGRGGRQPGHPSRQSTSDQTFHRLATLLTDRLRLALGVPDGSQVVQVVALHGKPIKAVTLQDWVDRTNVHGHTAFSCTTAGREVAAYYPPTREDGLGGNPYAR